MKKLFLLFVLITSVFASTNTHAYQGQDQAVYSCDSSGSTYIQNCYAYCVAESNGHGEECCNSCGGDWIYIGRTRLIENQGRLIYVMDIDYHAEPKRD